MLHWWWGDLDQMTLGQGRDTLLDSRADFMPCNSFWCYSCNSYGHKMKGLQITTCPCTHKCKKLFQERLILKDCIALIVCENRIWNLTVDGFLPMHFHFKKTLICVNVILEICRFMQGVSNLVKKHRNLSTKILNGWKIDHG